MPRRFSLLVLGLVFVAATVAGITGPNGAVPEAASGQGDKDAPAATPITVDGRTDDANYTVLGTSPAAPGSGFTGGVLTLKAHRGPDSLYVAVEGKLRAGEDDDTFREMMIFLNSNGADGIGQGTALPPSSDNLSPFNAAAGMKMDRETDYGVRITGGNDPQGFVSVVDYVSYDPDTDNTADDLSEGTVPDLSGTPVEGPSLGGRYAYQDAADLSSVDETGFEFAIPYSALAFGPNDAVQFFSFYGDVEGDNIAATLIPDDKTSNTYGNSENWPGVAGTQYTDVLGTVTEPFVAANILAPDANPPLYPFITSTDQTVTVEVSADLARVDNFQELRLFVDSTEVAATTSTSLSHPLSLDTPNRYNLRAEAEATANGTTVTDTTRTFLIRTPNVTEETRPSGVEDGINYNDDGSVTLSLNAPQKDFAYVLGDFNDWDIDPDYFMKKDGPHWWVTLPSAKIQSQTEYAFQYFVDGEHRIADPFSHKVLTPNDASIPDATYPDLKAYPDSLTEGFVSVLETDRPDFDFSSFTPPPQDQMVVYELLVRDFLEESNYQTLTDTLDYIDNLGVNAIELMPVAEFAGNNSWGYNPTFHLALDKAYGTRQKFKEFVEAAHNRGIAVIMDVVYNHIDSQSPLRQLYSSAAESPFLESNDDPPCSIFFEELNQSNPFIQDYIDRANRYWVEEFNVDGFRYDLAHCIGDGDDSGFDPVAGWKDIADYVWNNVDGGSAPFTYMILEFFGSTGQKEALANYRDGDAGGMPSWVGSTLNEAYSQSAMGYFNENANIEPAFFGFAGFNDPSYMPYMESHDEQWLMQKNAQFGRSADNGYDVKELQTALERQKLVGSFFFTLPGPRMTWQFAELGYGHRPDECLEDDGSGGICGPQAPGRTAPKPVRWEYRDPEQSPGRVDLYKTWRALLRLRNDNPELFAKDPGTGNPEQGIQMIANTGDGVRCIRLRDETLDATIVGNFGVMPFDATLAVGTDESACSFSETGTWHNFFEDKSIEVNGAKSFQLRPGEFRVYTSEEQPAPPMGLVPSAPLHRSTKSVNSDGTVDFGDTGVDIAFSGVSGSGDVTVETLIEEPIGPDGIAGELVPNVRYVIEAGGALSFDGSTEVRFDAGTIDSLDSPNNVVVHRRSTEGSGTFSTLSTSFESGPNEIVAQTGAFSEFALAAVTGPPPEDETTPVTVDGSDAEWGGSLPPVNSSAVRGQTVTGTLSKNTEAGAANRYDEYIWNDAAGDNRTDEFGDFVDGSKQDIEEIRLTSDGDSLYYLLQLPPNVDKTPGNGAIQLQVSLRRGEENNTEFLAAQSDALLPNASSPGGNVPDARWDYLFLTRTGSGSGDHLIWQNGFGTSVTGGAYALNTSEGIIEGKVPWSELGGVPGEAEITMTFSIYRATGNDNAFDTGGSGSRGDALDYATPESGNTYGALIPVNNDTQGRLDHAEQVSFEAPSRTILGTDGLGNDTGWRLLSAPAPGVTRSDLEDDLDFNVDSGTLLHTWDGSSWVAASSSDVPLPRGGGFILYFFDDNVDPLPSEGIPLDVPGGLAGPATDVSVGGLEAGNRFHLLGNPYQKAFDLGALEGPNGEDLVGAGFQATVQVWMPDPGLWTTITQGVPNDNLAAWQGFFVERASTGSGASTLSFKASGRQSGPGDLIGSKALPAQPKSDTTQQALVDLGLTVAQGADTLAQDNGAVFFESRATAGWDAFEATQLSPPITQAYATLNSPALRGGTLVRRTQASRPYPTDADTITVPLSVRAVDVGGTATVRWRSGSQGQVPGAWTVELEDTETGARTNLRDGPYTFDLDPGDGSLAAPDSARFRLHVQPSSTIPVEMTRFEASQNDQSVRLNWATASETGNAGFYVQRRRIGPQGPQDRWHRLGFVDGAGTTSDPRTYRFVDDDLPFEADSLTYRLRQVDLDGAEHYSDPRTVKRAAPDRVALRKPFPNPATQRVTFHFAVPEPTDVRVRVYDVMGRRVATWRNGRVQAGRHKQTGRVRSLASGLYFVRLVAGDERRTRRLTVVR